MEKFRNFRTGLSRYGECVSKGLAREVHDREYHYEMTDLPTTPTMMELHMMITSMIQY